MTKPQSAAGAAELKAIEQRLARKQAELGQATSEAAEQMRRRQELAQEADRLAAERERLLTCSEQPVVSEHAMLRYLERVKGVDLNAVRTEILADGRAELIHKLQSCHLPIGNGLRLVVKHRQVVSVVPHPKGTAKRRNR